MWLFGSLAAVSASCLPCQGRRASGRLVYSQVEGLLTMEAELKEEEERLRRIRACEQKID